MSVGESTAASPVSHSPAPPRPRIWRRVVVGTILAAAAGVAAVATFTDRLDGVKKPALDAWQGLFGHAAEEPHGDTADAGAPPTTEPTATGNWDGSITCTEPQRRSIGVRVVPVVPQSDPVDLELQGTTEYNPDTLLKIRPRFDALVEAVHATVGQAVKKGDPLVDLYSVKLAEAKLSYESKQSQAEHDRQIADHQRDLAAKGVIPESSRVLLDAVNLERRSVLEFKLARDELEVYGVSADEIARVHEEDGAEKAKMTLRAPGDGTIIARDVVVGNIYDVNDTLLVIASIEELWVWGHVYERDLDDVREGLPWEVHFPYTRQTVAGVVQYVANQVDPQTHAVRIRGSIPNPGGRFKSDQLVRVIVKCPPQPGQTHVPRRAVVTSGGDCFVFVQRPDQPDVFDRREIEVDREFSDRVIVTRGLEPGELVVTVGSLVMAQMWEDRHAVETGEAS